MLSMEVDFHNYYERKVCSTTAAKDLTFETLFKENTSKAVLTNYWEMIVHKLEAVGFEERDSFNMVTQLINMGFNPKQAYALESSINTINQYGMRRFRSTFGKKYERMFYDYKKFKF